MLRLDKRNNSGGIIVYIRNEYIISKTLIHSEIKAIYFQLKVKNKLFNFIYSYKSPNLDIGFFLDILEKILFSIDLTIDLFMIGDLNINLLESSSPLRSFINNFGFFNAVNEPTRIDMKFDNNSNVLKVSKTLIDVLIHNQFDNVLKCFTINNSFSDHKFV